MGVLAAVVAEEDVAAAAYADLRSYDPALTGAEIYALLKANALDLGSVWINQMKWLNGSELINEVLFRIGMKEDERVYGGLALGFADTEDSLPVRTPLPRTGNPVTFAD